MHDGFRTALAAVIVAAAGNLAAADTVTVAVASNFAETAEALVREFEKATTHDVLLVRGSSGRLFAQIANGAPIDVFLSADAERPRQLLRADLRPPDSAFVYAIGQLVVWSRDPAIGNGECLSILRSPPGKVAIANPRLAPYGAAARQFLEHESLWERLQPQLVYGENIAQTLQFAASGSASIALVARAQLRNAQLPEATCIDHVPANTHEPIEQLGVVTAYGLDKRAAAEFVSFIQAAKSRATIRSHGYLLPVQDFEDDRIAK